MTLVLFVWISDETPLLVFDVGALKAIYCRYEL